MKYAVMAALLASVPALADTPDCTYPAPAAGGVSIIGFSTTSDGQLTGTTLRYTSGNADLDAAAVACVSHWRFDPDNKADRHWTAPRLVAILWQQTGPEKKLVGKRYGVTHYCEPEAVPDKIADTALRFSISTDGHVRNAEVSASSGDSTFDRLALSCAARWRYKPAIKDGAPIEAPWSAAVLWSQAVPDAPIVVIEPVSPAKPQKP